MRTRSRALGLVVGLSLGLWASNGSASALEQPAAAKSAPAPAPSPAAAKAGAPDRTAVSAPTPVTEPSAGPAVAPAAGAQPDLQPSSSATELTRSDRPTGLDQEPADGEGLGWMLVKMVVTLGVVILLVYLVLNVGLRKMMGIAPSSQRTSVVKVVERITLEPKKSLLVVKAAGEYLLLGGAEGSITLLCKLDAAEVERIDRERPGGEPAALSPFLQKLLSRRGGPQPPTA